MGKKRRKRKKKNRSTKEQVSNAVKPQRDFTALWLALLSHVLLWLAMPGRDLSWLAWIAMVPIVWLIRSPVPSHKLLRQVWIATLLYWLVMLHFVRLPFWPLWFGWFALAGYLSVYGPLFVSISRTMVHRFRIPTVIAVPIVFTGLEWIRVNFLSGFGLGCVSHSQYKTPAGMQIAEFFGAYGVTFSIMLIASALGVATAVNWRNLKTNLSLPTRLIHLAITAIAFMGVVGFGTQQLSVDAKIRNTAEPHKHLKVALIQSSLDTILKAETLEQVEDAFMVRRDLTHSARLLSQELDLIVWPESALHEYYGDYLSNISPDDTKELRQQHLSMAWQAAIGKPAPFADAVPLLTGSTTIDPQEDKLFNSALLFNETGNVQQRYFKIHLVMFGEYFPVVHSIPVLKEFIKGFRSLNEGTEFISMPVKDVSIAPSICFETTVPHLIRRQINTLEDSGSATDVMVNVTNDGWFFGTSCLDLHLACNTLRAVEMRKPMLVSANTGFSAHIDEFGRHIQVGPRREEATLICDVRVPLPKTTVYRGWGAWLPCIMGWLSLLALALPYAFSFNNSRNATSTA